MNTTRIFDAILFIISLFGVWQVVAAAQATGHLAMPGAFDLYFIGMSILLLDRLTIGIVKKSVWAVALFLGIALLAYKNWQAYPIFQAEMAQGLVAFMTSTWVWWPLNFAVVLFVYRAFVYLRKDI